MHALIAYQVSEPQEIVRPGPRRDWMDQTHGHAYKCLPLVMANQIGFEVRCPCKVRASYEGGDLPQNLTVHEGEAVAVSHFGFGILTFHISFLFRTPPGINLLVTGPANRPKPNIVPLEGLVETDHSYMTFTMNWKFQTWDRYTVFQEGEPICRLLPYPRDFFEQFEIEEVPFAEMPAELKAQYEDWNKRRAEWNANMDKHGRDWMKDYMKAAKQLKVCPYPQ